MNLLLIDSQHLDHQKRSLITGQRAKHLIQVLAVRPEQLVDVGLINGHFGKAKVLEIGTSTVLLSIEHLQQSPPPALPCRLIMALPRPKMLRRILQTATAMGIKKIHLINSFKVEKSFWQSPLLHPSSLREQLILGLEQARDTVLPSIELHRLFKPFVEDQLPALLEQAPGLVAHPYSDECCPVALNQPSTLLVGPEGGFSDYEIEMLVGAGCRTVSLGSRILRTESVIPALLGRLYTL